VASKSRAVSAKGVEEFKPYITRALPISANLVVLTTLELKY